MNRANSFLLLILVIVCSMLSYFFIIDKEVALSDQVVNEQNMRESQNEGRIDKERTAQRLAVMESQIIEIANQLGSITQMIERKSDQLGSGQHLIEDVTNNMSIDTSLNDASYIDPFSPEGIALADANQTRYINQVNDIYFTQEIDQEWSESVAESVLPKLTDIESLASKSSGDADSTLTNEKPIDVSVANFECRSQLCATEIISGSVDEMIVYQNYMVAQTKKELPSIVFGVIEPFGSKFRMRAFLARDEYEFPMPN